MSRTRASRLRRNEQILTVLRAMHPQTFVEWNAECSPLKIGIFEDILALYPQMGKHKLHNALGAYTSTSRYLAALTLGIPRIDLSGNVVAPVSKNEMLTANGQGNRKFSKWTKSVRFETKQRQVQVAA